MCREHLTRCDETATKLFECRTEVCGRAHVLASASASLRPRSTSLPGKVQELPPGQKSFSMTFQVLEILRAQFQDSPWVGEPCSPPMHRRGCVSHLLQLLLDLGGADDDGTADGVLHRSHVRVERVHRQHSRRRRGGGRHGRHGRRRGARRRRRWGAVHRHGHHRGTRPPRGADHGRQLPATEHDETRLQAYCTHAHSLQAQALHGHLSSPRHRRRPRLVEREKKTPRTCLTSVRARYQVFVRVYVVCMHLKHA